MTKARIRAIRETSKANSAHQAIIAECLACIEELQIRTRRGEDLSEAPGELPLAAKVNPPKKARGTKIEFEVFASERGLTHEDGEYLFEKLESTGWKIGGKPIKDWRAVVRSWQAAKYFPSQQAAKRAMAAPVISQPARCQL